MYECITGVWADKLDLEAKNFFNLLAYIYITVFKLAASRVLGLKGLIR